MQKVPGPQSTAIRSSWDGGSMRSGVDHVVPSYCEAMPFVFTMTQNCSLAHVTLSEPDLTLIGITAVGPVHPLPSNVKTFPMSSATMQKPAERHEAEVSRTKRGLLGMRRVLAH